MCTIDGSHREVIGNITIPLKIGPSILKVEFLPLKIRPSILKVEFQVMNIKTAYTMFLGRPWIHSIGVVSSALHHRVKYVDNKWIVIVKGKEEMIIGKPSLVSYINVTKQVVESFFHSFEAKRSSYANKKVNSITKMSRHLA